MIYQIKNKLLINLMNNKNINMNYNKINYSNNHKI